MYMHIYMYIYYILYIYIYIYIYIFNLYIILTFRSWKKILKVFFLAVTRLILEEKKHILAIFRIIFQKNWHNKLRHHPYSCNLKIFFYHFFCSITKYDCAKFHVKSMFLSGFTQEEDFMLTGLVFRLQYDLI